VSDFCQIFLSNSFKFHFFNFRVLLNIILSKIDTCFGICKRFWTILLIFVFKTSQIISKHYLDFKEICIQFFILMYICCIYWCLRVAFVFISILLPPDTNASNRLLFHLFILWKSHDEFGVFVIVGIIHKWSQNVFKVFQPPHLQASNNFFFFLLSHMINFKSGPTEQIIS
jgi:hypothetical protein